ARGHLYGGLAALAARRPAVWWQHGVPTRAPLDLAAGAVPAAAIACVGTDGLEAQRRFSPRSVIVQIRPGVPIDRVAMRRGAGGEIRRRLGWDEHAIIGMVSRLAPVKGQDFFLRAAAI